MTSRIKTAIAAKMLHDASIHISGSGLNNVRAAQDILAEAKRYVRSGFRMPTTKYWTDSVETVFRLWPASKG